MTADRTLEKPNEMNTIENFKTIYSGKFSGVLRWPQLDKLWNIAKAEKEGWFIYAVGNEPPQELSNKQDTIKFIDEMDVLLRREHDEEYCGIVYANNLDKPTLIKIFDPSTLGTSCSIASQGPLPGWILSKMKPDDLNADIQQTGSRKRWWQKIFIKQ